MKSTILVIDDDTYLLKRLAKTLQQENYDVLQALDATQGTKYFEQYTVDAILLDIFLTDGNGIDMSKEMMADSPDIPVILMTEHSSMEDAVTAVKSGVYDYIEKPFTSERLLTTLRNALYWEESRKEIKGLQAHLRENYKMIGRSPQIHEVWGLIDRVAPSDTSVLVLGESGVGKELVARAVHNKSRRCGGKMICINCAAVPQSLQEAELFGHTKGAFTGAYTPRIGRLAAAHKGTLFLDEIGDLRADTQAALLRFLDSGEVQQIGSLETRQVDVRIVAATNKNLQQLVDDGEFRQDLYYRLAGVEIIVPPLRERPEDIPLLLDYFLDATAEKQGLFRAALSPAARNFLVRYEWPGNVRELINFCGRALLFADDGLIDLPLIKAQLSPVMYDKNVFLPLREATENFERDYIQQAKALADGNISRAAEMLGVERKNLYRKMGNLGMS